MPYRSVRATREECVKPLPGDDLIPRPRASMTHAVSTRATPKAIWPWLVQMGGGRAGWYSYDRLDNAGQPSATSIVADLQTIAVGDIMPALPGATDAFTVLRLDPVQALVIGWVLPEGVPAMTWAFVLEPIDGRSTRLVVRARVGSRYHFHGIPLWAARVVLIRIHFVMQRRQLLGIADRTKVDG